MYARYLEVYKTWFLWIFIAKFKDYAKKMGRKKVRRTHTIAP